MPSTAENAKEYYDRHSWEYVEKWSESDLSSDVPAAVYRRTMVETLVDLAEVESGTRVVEIGAGTGLVLRELLRRTRPVVGTDVSVEMLRRAREIFAPELRVEIVDSLPDSLDGADLFLVQDDVLEPKLPAGRFEAILSMEVLRYVGDLERALRNVRSLLADGGVFVFTVTNLWSLSLFPVKYELRRVLGRVDPANELMQFFVTEGGIRTTLSDLGFETVDLRKLNAVTFNPLVRRVVASGDGARRAIAFDRRLERVPALNKLFDTIVVAARKR
jgi:SAM-dependent methyltransferase